LPARIEALCGPIGVPRAAAHSLLAAAVDAVVHLSRGTDGRRRVAGVAVLVTEPAGTTRVDPAYSFDPSGSVHRGPGADVLDARIAPS
jgi:pilus assembly protein CpaF